MRKYNKITPIFTAIVFSSFFGVCHATEQDEMVILEAGLGNSRVEAHESVAIPVSPGSQVNVSSNILNGQSSESLRDHGPSEYSQRSSLGNGDQHIDLEAGGAAVATLELEQNNNVGTNYSNLFFRASKSAIEQAKAIYYSDFIQKFGLPVASIVVGSLIVYEIL